MSSDITDIPSNYVHPDVRLFIARRDSTVNAIRMYELCLELGIEPDSLYDGWSKSDIGLTEEFLNSVPDGLFYGADGEVRRITQHTLMNQNALLALRSPAEQLEMHVARHKLLLKKLADVALEKAKYPREWKFDGHFSKCPECGTIFGTNTPASDGILFCVVCQKHQNVWE